MEKLTCRLMLVGTDLGFYVERESGSYASDSFHQQPYFGCKGGLRAHLLMLTC